MPHISGSDVAGTVAEVGENIATNIKVGDKVTSYPNLTCRVCYECTSGREYDCGNRQVWGFQTGPQWGGFAQYTHLPEVNVVKLPDNVSFTDAAAISMVRHDSLAHACYPSKDKARTDNSDNGWRKWNGNSRHSNC